MTRRRDIRIGGRGYDFSILSGMHVDSKGSLYQAKIEKW